MYERHIILDLEFAPIASQSRKEAGMNKEIIQIGAVMLDSSYHQIGTFSSLVKPKYVTSIRRDIAELTGIHDDDLIEAPSFEEAIERFTAWVGQGHIRLYSWSDEDRYQMKHECAMKEIDFPSYRWNDFQRIYSRIMGCRKPLSLKNACASANTSFSCNQAHNALYDAAATAELLILVMAKREEFNLRSKAIREMLQPKKDATTIGDLYRAQFARFIA